MLVDDQEIRFDGLDGVLIYRDSENAGLFYACATRPGVARRGGRYQFAVVLYPGLPRERAATMSLVVDLTLAPATRRDAEERLRAEHPEAKLVDVPWRDGTVAASVLGGEPVRGTPSLLGGNSVALALDLTLDQCMLLQRAGAMPEAAPLSVVYGLTYDAYRKQYGYSIQFDETRFRTWVQKRTTAGFLFVSFEKVETFEDLQQSGAIEVVAEDQTGEGPPDGFRRAFLASLRGLLEPAPRFAAPSGAPEGAWTIGFAASSACDVQSIARRLDCDMSVGGAVSRTVFLQGPVDGLGEALDAQPPIDLSIGGRPRQTLTVRCHRKAGRTRLGATEVTITTPGRTTALSHIFAGAAGSDAAPQWVVDLDPAASGADAQGRVTLHFDGLPSRSAVSRVAIPPGQLFLDIVPSLYFSEKTFAVGVPGEFPWDLVTSVRVALRGPPGLAFAPPFLDLTRRSPAGEVRAFAPEPVDMGDIAFEAVYRSPGRPALAVPPSPAQGGTLLLNALRRRIVRFAAGPDVDWATWARIAVAIDEPADADQVWRDGSARFELTGERPSAPFEYWFAGSPSLDVTVAFEPRDPSAAPPPSSRRATSDARVAIAAPSPSPNPRQAGPRT